MSLSDARWITDLKHDVQRYRADNWLPPTWWLTERTIWAVAAFRLGQGVRNVSHPALRKIFRVLYAPILTAVQIATSVEIWPQTAIGPGMRIYHGTGLVVNPAAVIGRNVTLRQGVTIGSRHAGERVAPTIGDNVIIGAYAQILGDITIGDNARIAAHAVVLHDVPAGRTVVGPAARVLPQDGS